MQELKDHQNETYGQKAKSKQTENEMVFLERKMFWKVDKHKQNDQSGIPQTILFSFMYMQELKDCQNENDRQKSKSKQTENEMVSLNGKCFGK